MTESGYKPTGWLGLIVGTRLYFNFHSEAVRTDAEFMKQVDLVVRDLGDRGKAKAGRVSEGIPPVARLFEPAPAPAPAPATVRTPGPSPAPALAANSFTPSMQMSSPTAAMQRTRGTDDVSMVEVMVEQQRLMHEREEKMEVSSQAICGCL